MGREIRYRRTPQGLWLRFFQKISAPQESFRRRRWRMLRNNIQGHDNDRFLFD